MPGAEFFHGPGEIDGSTPPGRCAVFRPRSLWRRESLGDAPPSNLRKTIEIVPASLLAMRSRDPARLMGRIFFRTPTPSRARWCVRISNLIQTSVRNRSAVRARVRRDRRERPQPLGGGFRAGAWRRKGVRDAPPAKLTQSSGSVSSIVNASRATAALELVLHAAEGTPSRARSDGREASAFVGV